ncbi:MAG: hypothetical protein WCY30_08250 [Candidatus Neomarinimicrobiota bacterium]
MPYNIFLRIEILFQDKCLMGCGLVEVCRFDATLPGRDANSARISQIGKSGLPYFQRVCHEMGF